MALPDVSQDSMSNIAPNPTIDSNAPSLNPRPNLVGLDQSYTNQSSWYCYLPLESVLGKRYNNLDLHLTRFSLPQIEMGSMTTSYRGYDKEIPNKVICPGSKQLTLEYIVDEYWQNYKSLYAWLGSINGTLNPVTDDTKNGISPSDYLTMRIYLLNNYKRRVLQIEFYNCWIKMFGEVSIDYSSHEDVTHSFTFCYDDFRLVESDITVKNGMI